MSLSTECYQTVHLYKGLVDSHTSIDYELTSPTPKPDSGATFYDQLVGMTLLPFVLFILLAGPMLIGRFQKVGIHVESHPTLMPSPIHAGIHCMCALNQVDEASQAALDATFRRTVYYILFVVHTDTRTRAHSRACMHTCAHLCCSRFTRPSRSRCVCSVSEASMVASFLLFFLPR